MKKTCIFDGVVADLPIPFEEDGAVDWFGFGRILASCRSGGCAGFLVGGNEAETLSQKERMGLLEDAAIAAGGKGQVILSLQASKGQKNIEEAVLASECGATSLLLRWDLPLPPTGYFRLLRSIKKECPLPVLVHCKNTTTAGCLGLMETPACGVLEDCTSLSEKLLLSDLLEESNAPLPMIAENEECLALLPTVGYAGLLSRSVCCCPHGITTMWKTKNLHPTPKFQRCLRTLCRFFAGNEGVPSLKWALHRKGVCSPTVRLPFCEPEDSVKAAIERALEDVEGIGNRGQGIGIRQGETFREKFSP